MLFWLGVRPATLVHCCAVRCCSRRACTYSGGDPEHCLIPISSCCGSRPSKAAISLRALVPVREVVFDSTVISKNFVQLFTPHFCGSTFTPHFCGVLLLRIFCGVLFGKREVALSLMMERDDRLGSLDETEESSSEAGTFEGSDDGADEAATAAQHNYNLRTKRVAPGTTEEPALTKKSDIAPGVGVEAHKHIVGGRDANKPTAKRGVEREAAGAAREVVRADSAPTEAGARSTRDPPPQVVDRSGGVAWSIPVLRARGRPRPPDEGTEQRSSATRRRDAGVGGDATARARNGDSSPRGGDEPTREEWDAFRRARLTGRPRGTPPSDAFLPPNELARPGDSSGPSDAGRMAKSRREPSASDLLGQVPAKPGRGLFSDSAPACFPSSTALNQKSMAVKSAISQFEFFSSSQFEFCVLNF